MPAPARSRPARRRLARYWPVLALALLGAGGTGARAESLALAPWAATLPEHWQASGVKTEPTYLERVDIRRDGDRLSVIGGAPAWADRAVQALDIDAGGNVAWALCPPGMDCSGPAPSLAAGTLPSGFLATAGLIAAARQGRLSGRAGLRSFGTRQVVCLPGAMVGIRDALLDPCFDRETGAAIAESWPGQPGFDGPTLSPAGLRIDIFPATARAAAPAASNRG